MNYTNENNENNEIPKINGNITIYGLEGFGNGEHTIYWGDRGFGTYQEAYDEWTVSATHGASKSYIRDLKKIQGVLKKEFPEYWL